MMFWFSFVILMYIYFGYPLLVGMLARLVGREPRREPILPAVSLVIPAHNEEAYLEEKLRNSLSLDYPRDRLEIVVASDGSTDQTNAIAQRFRAQGVRLLALPAHRGKARLLNAVVPMVRSEIIVFSDVSSELARDAVRLLMRPLADPRVGCVCGLYRAAPTMDLRSQGEGLYWRYETWLKRQESRLHSILGAHGAFYAIRRRLFRPLDDGSINDDYLIPMRILGEGFRAIYEPSAVAWEREAVSVKGEFARRRRIAMGNCQQIGALRALLNPARGWVAWCFFSHKVLRTFAPLLLLALLISSAWLRQPWVTGLLILQGGFYASALAGYFCQQRGRRVRWLSPSLYFCLGNLAMLDGLLRFLRHPQQPAWERARGD